MEQVLGIDSLPPVFQSISFYWGWVQAERTDIKSVLIIYSWCEQHQAPWRFPQHRVGSWSMNVKHTIESEGLFEACFASNH
jgi:hypothetical protein